ncbi:MAG: hypothetical protein H6536_05325 [Bacteroidales bacterium]|nr:hypothetical protein [Bacteroidales bacterium]
MKPKLNYLGIVITLFLLTNCNFSKPKPTDYIGKEYKTLKEFEYFKDFEEKYGIVLDLPEQEGYSLAMYQKETLIFVALEKTVRHVGGSPIFQLLNVIEIEGIESDQAINFGSCRMNGEIDPTIFAIYNIDDPNAYIFKKILRAWRVNVDSSQFEQIDIQGIDCINEEYGYGVN